MLIGHHRLMLEAVEGYAVYCGLSQAGRVDPRVKAPDDLLEWYDNLLDSYVSWDDSCWADWLFKEKRVQLVASEDGLMLNTGGLLPESSMDDIWTEPSDPASMVLAAATDPEYAKGKTAVEDSPRGIAGEEDEGSCHFQDFQEVGEAVVLEVMAEIQEPKSGRVRASLRPWIWQPSSCRQHFIGSEENASDNPEAAPIRCKKASGTVINEGPFKENLQTSNLTESCCCKSLSGMAQAPSVFAPVVPDAPDVSFQSITAALHSAASVGQAETVAMLLAAGASPSCPTVDGATPLHRAARHGHIDTVKMLLDAGAEQRCDLLGFTPLHDAAYEGHQQTVRLLLNERRSACWISTTTPLDLAAHRGHEQTVGELLAANMWPVPHKGLVETLRPLQLAVLARHHRVVKLLLQRLKHFLAEELEEQK
eukprot:Skav235488  [mRNA]  locus=scaffold153:132515:137464:+ [translate_table: standard]